MVAAHLEVHGPPSGADADQFFADVHARTGRVRLATPDETPDVTLLVWLQRREQGFAAPGLVAGGDVFGDSSLDSFRVLAPSFRLSVHTTLDTTVSASQGSGSGTLAWTYGRAEACPLQLVLAPSPAARPCLLFDVGTLPADGNGELHTSSYVKARAEAGGLARLGWTLPLRDEWGLVLELPGACGVPDGSRELHSPAADACLSGPPCRRRCRSGSRRAFSVMRTSSAGHTAG